MPYNRIYVSGVYSLRFNGKPYIRQRVIEYGDKMPKKLTVLIKDDLDEKFREAVFEKKGMHKGNIKEAIEEAIELWINKQKRE